MTKSPAAEDGRAAAKTGSPVAAPPFKATAAPEAPGAASAAIATAARRTLVVGLRDLRREVV